jgi:predicted aspartyl protease
MAHPREFHTCEYTDPDDKDEFSPFVEISIFSGDSERKITALADTGCDPELVIPKTLLPELDLKNKINILPESIGMADDSEVFADIYAEICQVGGEKKIMEIYVLDTQKAVPALLGRGFFDGYDVLFRGKHRKLVFCHPE